MFEEDGNIVFSQVKVPRPPLLPPSRAMLNFLLKLRTARRTALEATPLLPRLLGTPLAEILATPLLCIHYLGNHSTTKRGYILDACKEPPLVCTATEHYCCVNPYCSIVLSEICIPYIQYSTIIMSSTMQSNASYICNCT